MQIDISIALKKTLLRDSILGTYMHNKLTQRLIHLIRINQLIKTVVLIVTLLLFSCQSHSPKTFCQISTGSSYCNEKAYRSITLEALNKFERYEGFKSFAIGKTLEQHEYFGFSHSYKKMKDAQDRAMYECRKQIDKSGQIGRCVLVR